MGFEPTLEQLLLYARRQLDAQMTDAIREHMHQGCENCQASLDWLSDINQVITNDPATPLPDVMSRISDRVYADFDRRKRETDPSTVYAQMTFDSAWIPIAEGTRAPAYGQRRVLFRAEPYRIDLEISGIRRGAYDLIGQILPHERITEQSHVILHRRPRRVVPIRDRGIFTIERVGKGTVDLSFRLPDKTVKLTEILIA